MGDDVYAAFESGADQNVWQSVGTSNPLHSQPPPSAGGRNPLMQAPPSKWGNMNVGSSWGAPGSRMGGTGGGFDARPMTSNRTAGYSTASVFDPAGIGRSVNSMGPAPPLQKRGDNNAVERCMEMERQVNERIEESAVLAKQGDFGSALEMAKEAGKMERQLCKQREQMGQADQNNADLTYAVQFNLAVQFQNYGLYTEALNTYSLIIRNTNYANAGRLRLNMANIYAAQQKYMLAIKTYRRTLDDVEESNKDLRLKIMRNIGNAFVKLGQYKDAAGSFEMIMEESDDIDATFNLLLCYYALGEKSKMESTFQRMFTMKPMGLDADAEEFDDTSKNKDILVDDLLQKQLKERREHYTNCILTAARLIAPVIRKDWRTGYDVLIKNLQENETSLNSSHLASELEMCLCLEHVKHKRYKEAIDGLKAFEKKDKDLRARAATNLAYLYFLEGDHDNGEKYSDMSLERDCYNAKALVNKGNFFFGSGEYEKAKQSYNDALAVEADNVEAIYNLGLTAKRLGSYEEALKMFKRVQSLVDSQEVLYQIADIYDLISDPTAPVWFHRLIGRVPTDPNVLARLGLIYAKEGDETQAFHYYLEAYRYYQVNMDVISWLGAYFVKNEVYDKAIQFFERATQIQPQEVKWQLMVASCHRRRGEYVVAKIQYEAIHRKHPENAECLRYLVHLCKDIGQMEEANEWFKKLKKVEQRQEQQASGKGGDDDSDSEGEKTGGNANGNGKDESSSAALPAAGRRAGGGTGPNGLSDNGQGSSDSDTSPTRKNQQSSNGKSNGMAADEDEDIELPGM